MASTPFLIPLAGLLAGIAAALCGAGTVTGLILVFSGLSIAIFLIQRRKNAAEAYRFRRFDFIWILLLMAGIGTISADLNRPDSIEETILDESTGIRGEILDMEAGAYGDRIIVDLRKIIFKGGKEKLIANTKAMVTLPYCKGNIGDLVEIDCRLRNVGASANRRDNGYSEYLKRRGILYSAWADEESLRITGHVTSLRNFSTEIRDKIVTEIELSGLNRSTVGFLVTVLTGDRVFLTDGTRSLFSEAGVSHALALSGMHIGIIISIIIVLLFPLNLFGMYKLRLFITLVAIWVYTFLTGMPPSAVRALIMSTFLFISIIIERKNNIFNSICGAAFLILLVRPYDIFDVGLQLSFCCILLIASFVGALSPVQKHIHPRTYTAVAFILTTLVASFGIWAVTAYYFKTVPLLVLPANIALLPLLPFYLAAAIFYIFMSWLGIRIFFLQKSLDFLYQTLSGFLEYLSDGGRTVLHFEVGVATVVLWILTVAILALYVNHKISSRKGMILSSITAVASVAFIFIFPAGKDNDGLIFQKRYDKVSVAVYEGNSERFLEPPASCMTLHEVLGKKIVTLDTTVPDTLRMHCDYLIVSRGFKGNIDDIKSHFTPGMVIIHPSLFRKREKEFLEKAGEANIKVHSLRLHGPLNVSFPKR